MQLSVRFIQNDGTKPKTLLAEAEVVFFDPDSALHGTKLVGFGVRRSDSGGTYVTLPARAFSVGDDRRYFDFLRAVSDDHETAKATILRVKRWVKDEWKQWTEEGSR
jgi:hypothetical protein